VKHEDKTHLVTVPKNEHKKKSRFPYPHHLLQLQVHANINSAEKHRGLPITIKARFIFRSRLPDTIARLLEALH